MGMGKPAGISVYRECRSSRSPCSIDREYAAVNQVYNVALNEHTSLNQLYEMLRELLLPDCPHLQNHAPQYVDFERGMLRHSQADISKANMMLGYAPTHRIQEGLRQTVNWYIATSSLDKRETEKLCDPSPCQAWPVNIYFAPALLHEKGGGQSAEHSGPMAKLCNTAPAFFVRNPKGQDRVSPALRYSPLTEAHSAARLVPRGWVKSVAVASVK